MVIEMKYENFYRRCTEYNFMLKDAEHFGVYSENRMKNAQDELGELLKMMSGDSGYAQYKPLLEEMYQVVSSRSDINRFLPDASRLQGKIRARKVVSEIPLYMLCLSALVLAGVLSALHSQ